MCTIKLTIIIPCYNRHDKLKRSVRSVLRQNINCQFELLIIDDGSFPPIELAPDFTETKNIKVLRHTERRGAAAARNTGVRYAKGKYFAFLDSDDIWLEGKINAQLREIEQHSDELIISGTGWFRTSAGRDTMTAVVPKQGVLQNDFYAGCWFAPGSTILLHRNTFFSVGYFDQQLSKLEDYDWFCRFASLGGKLVILNIHAAVIERGHLPNVESINTSISILVRKAFDSGDVNKIRLSLSYLWMEKASSYFKNGCYIPAIKWACLSWLFVPRFSIQLQKWWKFG